MINIETQIQAGKILLAKSCAWKEEIYARSAIIIISHNDEGSTGVMVNKMSNLSVYDALPEINHHAPLLYGGPVNIKTISYFHMKKNILDACPLINGLYWGGDYEHIRDLHENHQINFNQFVFCAGFVRWDTGKLVQELVENKWYLDGMHPSQLFYTNPDDIWSNKLLQMEKLTGLFGKIPEPSFN